MLRADDALSFPAFRKWRKYPQLCRGKFSKQEFLQQACNTGSGLTFESPHPEAVEIEQKEKLVGGTRDSNLSYAELVKRCLQTKRHE